MDRNKGKKSLPALFLLALLFLFPVLYMLFRSVYAVGDGISFLSYYEVLLGRPEYLVRFFRSLGMCLLIAAGQTLISCLAGTAFAEIPVYRGQVLVCSFCSLYDSADPGDFAAQLYSVGNAGIFEQLEGADHSGSVLAIWNGMAYLCIPGRAGRQPGCSTDRRGKSAAANPVYHHAGCQAGSCYAVCPHLHRKLEYG